MQRFAPNLVQVIDTTTPPFEEWRKMAKCLNDMNNV
jgi:hypothetical protein